MAGRIVPTLPNWTAGQRVLASQLQQITTWGAFKDNPPMFRMRQTIAQSIPNAGSGTVLTMDTSEYDSDSGRAVSTPWSYTIPTGMSGRWRFGVHVSLAAGTSNERDAFLFKNGTAVVGAQQTLTTGNVLSISLVVTVLVSAGDVMAPAFFQQSGGALNTFIGTSIMPYFEGTLISLGSP